MGDTDYDAVFDRIDEENACTDESYEPRRQPSHWAEIDVELRMRDVPRWRPRIEDNVGGRCCD